MTAEDWLPTLMAAAGEPDVKERLLKGAKVGASEYKVNHDGYNQLDVLTGKGKSNRREFYFYAETDLNAIRFDHWKLHFTLKNTWLGAVEKLDGALLFDIKLDPLERTPDVGGHLAWMKEKTWIAPIVGPEVVRFMKSLQDYPLRQKSGGVAASLKSG